MFNELRSIKLQILILIAISAITWSSSLNTEFSGYDDLRLILENKALENSLLSSFDNFWHNYAFSYNSNWSNKLTVIFRPLEQYAAVFGFKIWGDSPWHYHFFFNYLIHICNSILLLLICRNLIKHHLAVFVAVLIWAVHPLHSEAINMISSGTGFLLAHFFCFLAFYLFLSSLKTETIVRNLNLLLASIFLFISYLGSEMTLISPLVLIVIINCSEQSYKLRKSLLAITSLLIYLYLRMDIMLAAKHGAATDFIERLIVLAPQIFLAQLKLVFYPAVLSIDEQHRLVLENPFTAYHLVSLLVAISFIGTIIYLFSHKQKAAAYSLIVAAIYISVSLNITEIYCLARDRYTYIFVFGIVLALALIIRQLKPRKYPKTTIIFIGSLILALSVRSYIRNNDWKNGETLFQQTIDSIEDPGAKQIWKYKLLKYQRSLNKVNQTSLEDFNQFLTDPRLSETETIKQAKTFDPRKNILEKYSHIKAKSIASAIHYTANFNKKTLGVQAYIHQLELARQYDEDHFFNNLELLVLSNDQTLMNELISNLDKQAEQSFVKANKFMQALKQRQAWQLLFQLAQKYSQIYPTINYIHEYTYLAAIKQAKYKEAYQEAKILSISHHLKEPIKEFIEAYEAGQYQK
ncbi:MAG: hypothetical protein O3C63_02675 [Cyanobacteria bacterium]|nr:hypothetical protein [Cyanobacteriota bacterium]MDA1020089.1 hypothetical protein [Cyanobacteriota bacterium]